MEWNDIYISYCSHLSVKPPWCRFRPIARSSRLVNIHWIIYILADSNCSNDTKTKFVLQLLLHNVWFIIMLYLILKIRKWRYLRTTLVINSLRPGDRYAFANSVVNFHSFPMMYMRHFLHLALTKDFCYVCLLYYYIYYYIIRLGNSVA